ncbi:hypothetical protein GGE06_002404 [Streptomyces sp. SFB5A]|uniref:Uncharacterized protein n=1 Tax=Streptomyces nymphaeiformis TaxID=2663842 RepID=A0A7W7TY27_9ACTN|nr:hypothetical protein [Streptomyces nymphaeiformis]
MPSSTVPSAGLSRTYLMRAADALTLSVAP